MEEIDFTSEEKHRVTLIGTDCRDRFFSDRCSSVFIGGYSLFTRLRQPSGRAPRACPASLARILGSLRRPSSTGTSCILRVSRGGRRASRIGSLVRGSVGRRRRPWYDPSSAG